MFYNIGIPPVSGAVFFKLKINYIQMKRIIILLNLTILCFSAVTAQKKEYKYIDKTDLKAYMNFLASDEMQGRETGTNANNSAALFIESNLMRLGFKPTYDGRYLQKMEFISRNTLRSSLKATDINGNIIYSTDSLVTLISGSDSQTVAGDLLFAGYGYENSSTGYDDFKDIDLKGKIVLVMTRNPILVDSTGNRIDYVFDEMIEGIKLISLIKRGSKAVLIVYDPKSTFSDPYESGLAGLISSGSNISLKESKKPDIPASIFFITQKTADRLLSGSGTTLKQLQEEIDSGKKPRSYEVPGIMVSVQNQVVESEFTSYNIIGLMEGSDPVLKNECIVYTAHFDHAGINEKGEILNGADDNASGTSGLLEIAEAYSRLKKRPLRSVVFAWVNGEEKGLLGSEFYANHPLIPMEKTIININLDMIGRSITPADTGNFLGIELNITGPGEIQLFSENVNESDLKLVRISAKENGISIKEMGKDIPFGSSDHASLAEKGVPFLFFHSGIHTDLHAPGDDIDKIDFDKMQKVSRLAFATGYRIANLKWNK